MVAMSLQIVDGLSMRVLTLASTSFTVLRMRARIGMSFRFHIQLMSVPTCSPMDIRIYSQ
jgi:hypothetical protein